MAICPVRPPRSPARPYGPSSGWRKHGRVKLRAGLLGVVTLLFGSGCTKTDWIDRTLVTVDVTGVWRGTLTMSGVNTFNVEMTLEQRGAKVTGQLKYDVSLTAPALSRGRSVATSFTLVLCEERQPANC